MEPCLVGVGEPTRGSTQIGLEGCILGGREGTKSIPVGENSTTKSSEVPRTARGSKIHESRAQSLESNYLGLNPGSVTYSCGPWQATYPLGDCFLLFKTGKRRVSTSEDFCED